MAKSSGWLKVKLKRWLTYIVGSVVILALIAIGGFYATKPYLYNFAANQLAARGIKSDTLDLSILGHANLTNVRLPVPKDIDLTIGSMSARPPISFIPGSFTFYDVNFKRDNIEIQIPKITLSGVLLKDKDTSIKSNILQNLMRAQLGSATAPTINISVNGNNGQKESISIDGFWLSSLNNGHIGSVGINNLNSNVGLAALTNDNGNKIRIMGQTNALSAKDIDVAYAYSLATGKTEENNNGRTVIGPVKLNTIDFDIFNGTDRNAHFSLGTFQTSGLEMRPMKNIPEELLKNYKAASTSGNKAAQKAAQKALFVSIVSAITSIDAEVQKADIELPTLKASLNSFQLKPRQWNQSIPESLLVSLDNFSLKTSELPQEDLVILENMGLESIDLSGKIDFAFDQRSNTLLLNTILFDIKNIGSGQLSAKMVDVDKNLFSGDKDSALAALQKIGVTEIDMHYADYSFIDKFFTYLSTTLGAPNDNIKQELYDNFYIAMTQSPQLLIKDPIQAKKISDGLGEFAKNPKNLSIAIRAKDQKGLTALDLESALQNDLASALNKVNLTISTQ